MMRWVPLVLVGILLFSAGCSNKKAYQVELAKLRQTSDEQVGVLKKQNELLNRRLKDLNLRLEKLQVSSDALTVEFGTYLGLVQQVKMEVAGEINPRFARVVKNQDDFFTLVRNTFQGNYTTLQDSVNTRLGGLGKDLALHSSFVHFVAGEQDSINRVFAERIDERPWYQSILGKWEDRERVRKAQNP